MTGTNNDNISKKCGCERFCLILHDMPDDDRKLWQIRDDEEEKQTWDLDTIVFWLNRLHKENRKLKIENEAFKSLESINYQLGVRCHDCEKSLYDGREYLKKLNEKFEKIFGISLENFLDIEYKR